MCFFNTLVYDNYFLQAKAIFEDLYPEEPFFPRVPDPEDIIFGGEEEQQNEENVTIDEGNHDVNSSEGVATEKKEAEVGGKEDNTQIT